MLQREHSAILQTFIKLSVVIKIFVLSILVAILHRFYYTLYLLPFKCLPDDFAWIISRKNFRISAVPFSIILTGGNSRGLLVIFNPFNVLISPEIYLEKVNHNSLCHRYIKLNSIKL